MQVENQIYYFRINVLAATLRPGCSELRFPCSESNIVDCDILIAEIALWS